MERFVAFDETRMPKCDREGRSPPTHSILAEIRGCRNARASRHVEFE